MAIINVKDTKIKKVIVTSPEQLIELADKLAPGMGDAINEFFIQRNKVPQVPEMLDDYEGPDEDNIAGMDNEYFEDEGEI